MSILATAAKPGDLGLKPGPPSQSSAGGGGPEAATPTKIH